MSVPQQKFREIVFQILYSQDLGKPSERDISDLIMKELAVTRKVVQKAQERVNEIIAIFEETDSMIASASVTYDFDRIQTVERNILRLGIYELFFDQSIPPKVAISEAMRLARKFGSPESANFVNAILDTLYKASLGEKVDQEALVKSSEELLKSEEQINETGKLKPTQEINSDNDEE